MALPPDPVAAPQEPHATLTWQWLRGGAGLYVFRVEDHAPTGRHDHLFHEIVLIESGTAEHQTADGFRALRPGDLIVLRPLTWHAYLRPRRLRIINCLIDTTLMRRLGALLTPIPGAFELLRRRRGDPHRALPTMLHASPAGRETMRQQLEAVIAEQRAESLGWQSAATAALLQFLVAVARLAAGAGPHAAPAPSDRTARAVLDVATGLERDFTESVSLDALAAGVHLSPAHLSRSFSRHMGMGIVQYLHRIRAEEACRLLRYTDHPISAIAARVGYDEIAYFSRCFRAQMKQSPRQYRLAAQRRPDGLPGSP